jgi:hypothetical protein
MEHELETVVELSNGDVTFGSRRLLAAGIGKIPLRTNEKTQTTCERYTTDTKHVLDTNRKPWSLYHTDDVTSGLGRPLVAEIDKLAINDQ